MPQPAVSACAARVRSRPPQRPAWLLGFNLIGILLLCASTGLADEDPFALRVVAVQGRPTQVWPARVSSDCPDDALDLLVISLEGGPPDEIRRLSVLPCGSAESLGPVAIEIEPNVVAVDAYDVDARPGAELIFLDQQGVQIHAFGGETPPRRIAIEGGLPLPPRERGLSRMPVVEDWNGDGTPVALLPTLRGGLLIDLASGTTRRLELPLIAQYRTWDPDLPARVRKLMISEVHWPVLMRGDDNGDGRVDLFALTRWRIWVFRSGPDGLPGHPSRRIQLRPFSPEEEVRFEATDVTYFAADLDGDRLTDLMLHRISGGVMDGKTITDIHLNKGDGARGSGEPDARLEVESGFSGYEPMDLDGDGRSEIVEISFEFGIMQLIRVLLTRKSSVTVRILNADPKAPGQFRKSWEDDMTFRLNFDEGRVEGLFPTAEGDWNGDGYRDLLYPDGRERLAIRLGEAAEAGPRFGKSVARQRIELDAGRTRVADVNGDGLDDLIAYDPLDVTGRIFVLTNRGILPGTRDAVQGAAAR